jgi:hypothetical protein
MTNPYPKRVLTLALSLLALSVLMWLIATAVGNNGGDESLVRGTADVSGWAFNAAFMATLAWLVLKGVTWRSDGAAVRLEEPAKQL